MLSERFSEPELSQWRGILEQRKRALLAAEKSLRHQALEELSGENTGEISKVRLHPADLASNSRQIETLGVLSQRKIKNIQEVEAALNRIDQGSFGRCANCGEAISPERLKIIPESSICQNCAQEAELPEESTAKSVSDIMRLDPITINMNESIDTALELLSDNKIRHLPVVDKRGDLQGIISDRDLLGAVVKIRSDELSEQIKNIMTKYPESVNPETDLIEAARLLLDNKISCLPVLEGTRLVGIVTEADYVKLYCREGANL